jgi:hypothetical protein
MMSPVATIAAGALAATRRGRQRAPLSPSAVTLASGPSTRLAAGR